MTDRVTLEVRMFGALQVSVAGSPLVLRERTAKRLFAYLVLQRGVGRTRAAIVARLWTDTDETAGRRALRQGLWHLRRALGAAADRLEVHAELVSLRLEAHDRVDIYELDRESADDGEFLDGWIDEWVLEVRGSVAAERLERLEALALEAEGAGRAAEAVVFAQRALKLDGLRESMHRMLIRAQLQAGDRQRALAQFRTLEAQLRDLGVDPEADTLVLAQRAQRVVAAPPSAPERTVFIGRQAERAALREAVGSSNTGAVGVGRVVWVEGESGIGKSRLVEEFTCDAARRGRSVLWGDCDEGAGQAFQPLARALKSGLDDTKSLWLRSRLSAPVLSALGGILEQFHAPSNPLSAVTTDVALRAAFGQLAEIGPMTLVIDDLQWADRATLSWLSALAERIEDLSFSLILIVRASETGTRPDLAEFATHLAQAVPFVFLALEPLGTTEASSLVAQVTDNDQQLQQALLHGRGNPLMLLELARHAWARSGDSRSAARFKQQVAARLEGLTPSAKAFAERLAVVTLRLPLGTLVAEDGLTVLRDIESLVRLGLIVAHAEGVEVAHDALRDAIRAQLECEPPILRARHAEALRWLRRTPSTPAATLAHHAEMCQQYSEAARDWLQAARQANTLHAYELALEQAQRGLRCLESTFENGLRDGLRCVRLPALEALGHWAELVEACDALLADGSSHESVRLEALAARALLRLGRFEEAQHRAGVALARAGDEPVARLVAVAAVGLVAFRSGQLHEALQSRREAVRLAAEFLPEQRAEHEYLLANSLIEAGQLEEAKRLLAGVARCCRSSNPAGYADALARLGLIWLLAQQPKRALSAYRIAIERYRATNKQPAMAATLNSLAALQRDLGEVALSLETHERALTMYRAMRDRVGEVSTRLNLAVLYAVELGATDQVITQLELIQALGVNLLRTSGHAMIAYARSFTASTLEDALRPLEQHLTVERPWTGADLSVRLLRARLTARNGDLKGARTQLRTLEKHTATLEMADVKLALAEWCVEAAEFTWALEITAGLDATPNTLPTHITAFIQHRAWLGLGRVEESLAALARARMAVHDRLRGFSAAQLNHATECALEVQPIQRAWNQFGTRQTEIDLPASSHADQRGKSGRTRVTVRWTPWEYSDSLQSDSTRRRQHQLERIIEQARQQGASPTLQALRSAVGVSLATVKRDLVSLRLKTGSASKDAAETQPRDNTSIRF